MRWFLLIHSTRSHPISVRAEQAADVEEIHRVNRAAFGSTGEADLVDVLRQQAAPLVSLVADDAGSILGHILFSPVTLSGHPELKIVGLAPMAVVPALQREGIGSALVRAGLEQCKRAGHSAVVVLGHPEYYPRFGFTPASRFGIGCEYDVPDEVFMALELQAGVLTGKTGTIQYHPAFRSL